MIELIKKRSVKNIFYSLSNQIILIILGLILPRLYLINYGSEINGLLNSANQFLVYISLFEAGIGAVTLQSLYKPVSLGDKKIINSILSATSHYYKKVSFLYFFALIILSSVYPFIAKSDINYAEVMIIVFFSGLPNFILFLCQGKYNLLLQAEGKNYINTNLNTIINILIGMSKIILIILGCNVVIVVIISFFIRMIQAVYIMFYIKRNYTWINLTVQPCFDAINQKNYSLIHQISGMIFQNTDILLLTFFCDLKVVSLYTMYKLIVTQIENFLRIISDGLNFALGQLFQTNTRKYKVVVDLFESYFSALGFSLLSVAMFLYIPFMELYTKNVSDINYIDKDLAILFIIVTVLTIIRIPMLNTINYAGHFKLTTPQSILETVINLVCSLFGVYFLGIYGVLIGTVIALIYRTNDVIIYANVRILKRKPWHTYKIYVINILLFFLMQYVFCIFSLNTKTWFDFLVSGIILLSISILTFFLAQTIFIHIKLKKFD